MLHVHVLLAAPLRPGHMPEACEYSSTLTAETEQTVQFRSAYSRAQTSIRAELPSGKVPTTRVRRRISRLCQKTYVADFLDGRQVENDGTVPQQRFGNHHEAIVEQFVYEQVQKERERRSKQH